MQQLNFLVPARLSWSLCCRGYCWSRASVTRCGSARTLAIRLGGGLTTPSLQDMARQGNPSVSGPVGLVIRKQRGLPPWMGSVARHPSAPAARPSRVGVRLAIPPYVSNKNQHRCSSCCSTRQPVGCWENSFPPALPAKCRAGPCLRRRICCITNRAADVARN